MLFSFCQIQVCVEFGNSVNIVHLHDEFQMLNAVFLVCYNNDIIIQCIKSWYKRETN